jgi:hypothetical protein
MLRALQVNKKMMMFLMAITFKLSHEPYYNIQTINVVFSSFCSDRLSN